MQVEQQEVVETKKIGGRRATFFLLVTVFLGSMGMTVVMPVMPFIVQNYVTNQSDFAAVVGWLGSSYAICQFIAAPGLGLLSDRFGRRRLLLICLFGSVIGYILFGIGGALWVLFLGRIIDGITGGNFSILFAYIADVTKPEERGKFMGMCGAVSGVGFILGPAIGGFAANFGNSVPVYMAAGLTVANILWGYFFLPESLSKEKRRGEKVKLTELNPLKQVGGLFRLKYLRPLLIMGILYSLPFAVLQSNLGVLAIESLNWTAEGIGLTFLLVGAMDILVQGGLVGRLIPIFGEAKLLVVGFFLQVISYLMFGFTPVFASPFLMIGGIALFAFSSGLIEPTLGGLVSRVTEPDKQGVVQGGNMALHSLALIVGPVWGGTLYSSVGHPWPYWVGAGLIGIAMVATLLTLPGRQFDQSATGSTSYSQ